MKQVRVKAVCATAAVALTIAACNGGDNTEPAPPPDNETLEDPLSESQTDEDAESNTDDGDGDPADDESATDASPDDASEPSGEDARWVSPDARDEHNLGASGDLEILDLRSAPHEYYDRVVLDLEGNEMGWSAGFTDEPMQAGSGFDIDIEGSTFLEIAVSGFAMPDEDDDVLEGEIEVDGHNTREAYIDGWFEGQRMIYIGVDDPGAYRLFVLEHPDRLVIDIENDAS